MEKKIRQQLAKLVCVGLLQEKHTEIRQLLGLKTVSVIITRDGTDTLSDIMDFTTDFTDYHPDLVF